MAGVDQGDRIRSLDLVTNERRVNALEAVLIQTVITSASTGTDAAEYNRGGVIGRTFSAGESRKYFGAWKDSSGNTFLGEESRIRKFNTSTPPGNTLNFGSSGSGNGQFDTTRGIAGNGSNIFVVDQNNNRVQKFSLAGSYVSQHGTLGSGNGQLSLPTGIAFEPGGNYWVVDRNNNRLQKFNVSGTYLAQFGSGGSGNGQFSLPSDVAIDASGFIYVSDLTNNRVQKFNSAGTYQTQWAVGSPQELEVAWNGEIYVAAATDGELHVYSNTGTKIGEFEPDNPVYGVAVPFGFGAQTEWFRYPTTSVGDKVSLGTPDAGVSVPVLTAFEGDIPRLNEIADIHDSIEVLAPTRINSVTGNPFDWTGASADNLYHVAVESGVYDWQEVGTHKDIIREDLIDEIDGCLTKLEASDLA